MDIIMIMGLIGCIAYFALTQIDSWPVGRNIQRTMRLLATSTQNHPNRVKVLFYGQSITKQDWWKAVSQDLRRRYPYANLTCENRAIGGFAANLLKKVVQHDVFPSYPDLIVLHDYGGEPDYEDLIRLIRANVSSEVLVQSDHYVNAAPRAEEWHDRHVGWLMSLAEKYDLGFVDVRTPWKRYLDDRHMNPDALTIDGSHLNAEGCGLMASLIEKSLIYEPSLPDSAGLATELPVRWNNGRASLAFDGNRVDLNLGPGAERRVSVLIDGKRPSEIPELYRITRPSDCYELDVPAVFRIDSKAPLLIEDWTLTLVDCSPDASEVRFRVRGSKTGDDGEGTSSQPFVSRSGRVVIDPGSWYLHMAFEINGKRPPNGFEVRWQVIPEFKDEVTTAEAGPVTVAQGLINGRHSLQLIADGVPPIKSITIYRPPVH